MAAALGAAIVYGAAYPATAIALRSFSPLAIAGLSCTLALVVVIGLAAGGVLRAAGHLDGMSVRAGVAARRPGDPRRHRLHRRGQHRGGRQRPDDHRVHRTAVRGPWPRCSRFRSSASGSGLDGSRRVRPCLRRHGTAGRKRPRGRGCGRRRDRPRLRRRCSGCISSSPVGGAPGTASTAPSSTIANLIGRGPVLLAAALVLDPAGVVPATPDPAAVVALLTIAFGASMTGNLLLMASVRRIPAARTSAALLLTPVASAAIAAILLGERLPPGGLAGACLILGSDGRAPAASLSLRRPAGTRKRESPDRAATVVSGRRPPLARASRCEGTEHRMARRLGVLQDHAAHEDRQDARAQKRRVVETAVRRCDLRPGREAERSSTRTTGRSLDRNGRDRSSR